MLIHSADVMETIQRSEEFGIKASVESIDWDFSVKRVSDEVDGDSHAVEEGNHQHPNITVFRDTVKFTGEKTLEVNGDRISGETIIIAAGTRPYVPDIPGLNEVPYITSDQALRLPEQPRRMTIVGGGYLAAELAHFFGALGTEVTIVHRGPFLLRSEDHQITHRFTEIYQHRFNLMLSSQVTRASHKNGTITLDVVTDGKTTEVSGDALLMATGRISNTDILDVASAGVEVDQEGFVKTDEHLQTNVPGIWALGDIVGKYLLRHSANLEAAYVAYNILHPDHKVAVDYHAMPHAIFASPQVAGVGITEQEAKGDNLQYVAGTYDYHDTAYGSSIEDKDGFVKVLAHPETGEIQGRHIIGTDAAALIQEAVNAMRLRLGTDAITQSIYIHPALPEVVQRAFGSL